MKSIECNESSFNEIKLLYSSVDGKSLHETLNHKLTIEGLMIGEKSVFVNLLIDTCSRHSTPHTTSSAEYRPSIKNLMCFKGKNNTEPINIIEKIGSHYFAFGVQLLNDEDGSYVKSVENELLRDSTAINCKILTEWSNGRRNAQSFEWRSLVETLKDIGLRSLAYDIIESALNQ